MKKRCLEATRILAIMAIIGIAHADIVSDQAMLAPISSDKEVIPSSTEAGEPIPTSLPASTYVSAPMPATSVTTAMPQASSEEEILNPPSIEAIIRPGNHRSNFELDLMFPLYQHFDRMIFIDLRGMRDTLRNTEGNFGVGYRQIIDNRFVLGIYAYGDYRRTRLHNNFGQLTIGVDVLTHWTDGRLNLYIGDTKSKLVPGTAQAAFVGSNIQTVGQYEQAMSGLDGEIGFRIPNLFLFKDIEARVFAGGYYFARSGMKTIAGPRGRFELRILDFITPGSRLTLGVDVSTDKVRKTNVFGNIGLRIPLQATTGKKLPQGLQRRLADYVYRDVDAVTNTISIPGRNLQLTGGKDAVVYTVTNGGTGSGSFGDSAGKLATAPKDVDIFYFTGEETFIQDIPITLTTPKQQVVSDGAPIFVTDANTGISYKVINAGNRKPVAIHAVTNGAAIIIKDTAKDVTVSGLGFVSNSAQNNFVTATFTTAGQNTLTINDVTMAHTIPNDNMAIQVYSLNDAITNFSGKNLSLTRTMFKLLGL